MGIEWTLRKYVDEGTWTIKYLCAGETRPLYIVFGNSLACSGAPSYNNRVATVQEMVRDKKVLQGQGNVREFYFVLGKIKVLKKRQRKLR